MKGRHPFLGYLGSLILGIILVAIILFLVIFGFVDQNRHQDSQQKSVEKGVGNTAKNIYKGNRKQFAAYTRQRTNNDTKQMQPKLAQVKQIPRTWLNNHSRAKISNVQINDSGNGSFMLRGHHYGFRLADIQFAPHVSKFYKTNHQQIDNIISNQDNGKHYFATKTNNNQIYLYNGPHLVNNQFLDDGIAYIPNWNQAKMTMKMSEDHAKRNKTGIWYVPKAIGGNKSDQVYSTSAEYGHKVAVLGHHKSATNNHGGKSAPQRMNKWLDKH